MTTPLKPTLVTTLGIALALAFSTAPVRAESKALLNGKPFVELNGQIVEAKSSLDDINSQYDAIMARIDALEADLQGQIDGINNEIYLLKQSDLALKTELDALIAQALQNSYDIKSALAQYVSLQAQIDALLLNVGANADLLATLQTTLADLKTQMDANANGITSILGTLQQHGDLISLLNDKASNLRTAIDSKQNDIVASCPAGTYVYGVLDDGTLQCAQNDAQGELKYVVAISSAITVYNVRSTICDFRDTITNECWISHTEYMHRHTSATARCPYEYRVTGSDGISRYYGYFIAAGGGYSISGPDSESIEVILSYAPERSSWFIDAKNTRESEDPYTSTIQSYAICVVNKLVTP